MSKQEASKVFDEYADQYDAWYGTPRGQAILDTEVACVRPLLHAFARPYLEVGAGTGRFAHALGVAYGTDPSVSALEIARTRGVTTSLGVAEAIPFGAAAFGAVLVAFTLCFVQDPHKALSEVRRVLTPGGGLVLGLLLKGTPWADFYARRGKEGHRLYSAARFYTVEGVEALLLESGFRIRGYRSSLFQGPEQEAYQVEQPVKGYVATAGFVAIAAVGAQD